MAYNITTNFLPSDHNWKMELLPIEASQAMEMGSLVNGAEDGTYELCDAPANLNIRGILAETIAATDADYATSGKLKGVWVPKNQEATAFFTVGAGTFTAADVGKPVDVHTDGKSLAVDGDGTNAFITKYHSSTRGECRINFNIAT